MTLVTMREAVNRRTGLSFSDLALNDSINDALQQLSRERPWPWLLTSSTDTYIAAQTTTALPSNFESMVSVRVGQNLYQPVTVDETDTASGAVGDFGMRGYSIYGTTMTLRPAPAVGTVVAYRYKKQEAVLSGDSDTPTLPTAYQQAVIELAASLVLERSGDVQQSRRHDERYQAAFRRLERAALRPVRGPHRIMVRPGSGL